MLVLMQRFVQASFAIKILELISCGLYDAKVRYEHAPVGPSFNGSFEHTCRTSCVKVLNFLVMRHKQAPAVRVARLN